MRHHVIRYDFNTSSANKYIEVNTAHCRKVTRDPAVDPQRHRACEELCLPSSSHLQTRTDHDVGSLQGKRLGTSSSSF